MEQGKDHYQNVTEPLGLGQVGALPKRRSVEERTALVDRVGWEVAVNYENLYGYSL